MCRPFEATCLPYVYLHTPFFFHLLHALSLQRHLGGFIFVPCLLYLKVSVGTRNGRCCKQKTYPRVPSIEAEQLRLPPLPPNPPILESNNNV